MKYNEIEGIDSLLERLDNDTLRSECITNEKVERLLNIKSEASINWFGESRGESNYSYDYDDYGESRRYGLYYSYGESRGESNW